jgi:hypothetical protein
MQSTISRVLGSSDSCPGHAALAIGTSIDDSKTIAISARIVSSPRKSAASIARTRRRGKEVAADREDLSFSPKAENSVRSTLGVRARVRHDTFTCLRPACPMPSAPGRSSPPEPSGKAHFPPGRFPQEMPPIPCPRALRARLPLAGARIPTLTQGRLIARQG